MSREGSYAPKSPDLSSFYSTPAPVAAQHQPPQPGLPVYQQQNQRFLAPQQPYYQPPPQYAQPYISTQDQHQHQHQHQHQQPPSYCLQPPQQQQEPLQVYGVAQPPPPPPPPPSQYPNHQPFLPGYGGPQYPQPYGLPSSGYQQPGGFYPPPQPLLHEPATTPTTPQTPKTPSPPTMPPRKAAVAAAAALASSSSAAGAGTGAGAPPPPPPPTTAPPPLDASKIIAPSPVKTKFPTARIKRIMQADEEVGKVSQQTPIAVGKALELFMVALVTRSADVARTKNSKRVTAPMLKQVVETDDQWDFLRDIVKKVDPDEKHARGGSGSGGPGGPAGRSSMGGSGSGSGNGADGTAGSKTKLESDSEDEQPRKRGRPGRKKKV